MDLANIQKGIIILLIIIYSSHVWMWELDHKEGWAPKNWCFQTVVLEKILQSPLDSKIKPMNPKGNQPWIFTGRTDAEAEAPILWPPDAKSWLLEKTLMLEKIEGKGEGSDRGWDGWMASLSQWTWVWASSRRYWRTEKPGVLQFMGLQSQTRLRDWTTTTTVLTCEASKHIISIILKCTFILRTRITFNWL